jgi:RNA polymerase sigma-70 factor (ECF subfamily)
MNALKKDHIARNGNSVTAQVLEECPCPGSNPEALVLERERWDGLRSAIRTLTDHQRQCLHLRAEGLRYREIAETLGITVSSVVDTLTRAVEKLRKASDD